jgi:hypothetical protein
MIFFFFLELFQKMSMLRKKIFVLKPMDGFHILFVNGKYKYKKINLRNIILILYKMLLNLQYDLINRKK